MNQEWVNEITTAIDSTDWIANIIQIILGVLSIIIPIIFAIWVSQRESKEIKERQQAIEENIQILSENQITSGLLDRRLNTLSYVRNISEDFITLYKQFSDGLKKDIKSESVFINCFAPEVLNFLVINKLNSTKNPVNQSSYREMAVESRKNIRELINQLNYIKLLFVLNGEQNKFIEDLICDYKELYNQVTAHIEAIFDGVSPKNSKISDIYEKLDSNKYELLIDYLEGEIFKNKGGVKT